MDCNYVYDLLNFEIKFCLKGGSNSTAIKRDDNNFNFDKAKWAPWTVPTLQ